jgi:APA family basic amino acid/polyamine antiporter
MGAFLYVGLPLSGIASQLWLRRQQPELPRPFQSWGYPVTPWLVGMGSLAFLIGALISDTGDSLLALALLGLGAIAGEAWQRLLLKQHQAGAVS